jgi:Xaa-Pro aminopeptidase
MRITPEEHTARRERLLEHVRQEGLSGYAAFGATAVQYLTGFWFLSTERPVVFAQSVGGETIVLVPEFEVARTEAEASFDRVASYREYPGEEHPMLILARVLEEHGIRDAIAADQDGYPGILGYSGPSLSDVTGARVVPVGDAIEQMVRRKSDAEIELIRESARWCERAHRRLQEYSVPGVTEAQASLRAQHETTLELLAQHGEVGWMGSGDAVKAGYRGQVGLRSAWAHAVAHAIPFERGDVLVSETGAPIWGYNAELERAMVIGEPNDEVRRLFGHMVAAQDAAFEALRPGVACADVDRAVLRYFEEHDLMRYWRQHVGHAIGLGNHEAPFLDVGDHTVVEPGMVFTIEPGVYDESIGGFRHSDTVVVREDGIEILTDYPRDLDALVIPG